MKKLFQGSKEDIILSVAVITILLTTISNFIYGYSLYSKDYIGIQYLIWGGVNAVLALVNLIILFVDRW